MEFRMDVSNEKDIEVMKTSASRCRGHVHVVEKGDTLYKIAKKYDVRLFDVMRLNPYVNVYNLQIGDEICVPVMSPTEQSVYIVKDGETIGDVLERLRMDFDTLAELNPTLLEVPLLEGLTLKLPVIQPREHAMDDHNTLE